MDCVDENGSSDWERERGVGIEVDGGCGRWQGKQQARLETEIASDW